MSECIKLFSLDSINIYTIIVCHEQTISKVSTWSKVMLLELKILDWLISIHRLCRLRRDGSKFKTGSWDWEWEEKQTWITDVEKDRPSLILSSWEWKRAAFWDWDRAKQSEIDVLECKIDFSITCVSYQADTRSPLGTINFWTYTQFPHKCTFSALNL
jgi:hypothetical protein